MAPSALAYYFWGNLAGYDHWDSIPLNFTHNAVEDDTHQGRRVCAGQAHTDGSGFYGSYLCASGFVDKSYSTSETREARAHNGESFTNRLYAYVS